MKNTKKNVKKIFVFDRQNSNEISSKFFFLSTFPFIGKPNGQHRVQVKMMARRSPITDPTNKIKIQSVQAQCIDRITASAATPQHTCLSCYFPLDTLLFTFHALQRTHPHASLHEVKILKASPEILRSSKLAAGHNHLDL